MNIDNLWDDIEYSERDYISEPFDLKLLQEIELELGYKLPSSYVKLMESHNGGLLKRSACPCNEPTSWSSDHVGINGIFGIGKTKPNSLCGTYGSKFWIEEWEYPNIGIAICDCPSSGHDMIFLDYRECGKDGEPKVVHIDQEYDYKITFLAENFEEFINKLCLEDEYDDEIEEKVTNKKYYKKLFFPLIIVILVVLVYILIKII